MARASQPLVIDNLAFTRLVSALEQDAIRVGAVALDWQHSIEMAGELLLASGRTSPGYAEAMITAIEELGPYVVIAPGLALAHAKPSELVFETGLSLLTLAEPIEFGHGSNDPVNLVFALAAIDHDSHLGLLAELSEFLTETSNVNFLLNARSADEILDHLKSAL